MEYSKMRNKLTIDVPDEEIVRKDFIGFERPIFQRTVLVQHDDGYVYPFDGILETADGKARYVNAKPVLLGESFHTPSTVEMIDYLLCGKSPRLLKVGLNPMTHCFEGVLKTVNQKVKVVDASSLPNLLYEISRVSRKEAGLPKAYYSNYRRKMLVPDSEQCREHEIVDTFKNSALVHSEDGGVYLAGENPEVSFESNIWPAPTFTEVFEKVMTMDSTPVTIGRSLKSEEGFPVFMLGVDDELDRYIAISPVEAVVDYWLELKKKYEHEKGECR